MRGAHAPAACAPRKDATLSQRFSSARHAALALLLPCFVATALAQSADTPPAPPDIPQVLYGAAYYSEYEPYDRLDQDIAMMKAAGLNVVRMGESTWSLWEPEDGHFEYAWMDRVVDAMSKAGIKVILGTPTYNIPTWLYHEHPEILVRKLGGGETVLRHAPEHGHRKPHLPLLSRAPHP